MEESVDEAKASATARLNTVDSPTEVDILMGRGKLFQDFPGTARLRQLVEDRRPVYEKCRKKEKIEIITGIINTVKATGGRFLKKEMKSDGTGCIWVVADAESVHRKVNNAFQSKKRTASNLPIK